MRTASLTGLLACSALLAGCSALPFGYTRIGDILATPAQFEGKEVKVKGKVTGAVQVPVVEFRSYTLSDETGEIAVLTKDNVPSPQQEIAVTGIVRSLAIIGGQSLGLRLEETKRH